MYDRVGKMRIPYLACDYHAIKRKFQPKEDEEFVSYQDDHLDDLYEHEKQFNYTIIDFLIDFHILYDKFDIRNFRKIFTIFIC